MIPKIIQRIFDVRDQVAALSNRHDDELGHCAKLSKLRNNDPDITNTFTVPNVYNAPQTVNSSVFAAAQASTGAIDVSTGTVFVLHPDTDENISVTFSGAPASGTACSVTVIILDGARGSISWPSNCTVASAFNMLMPVSVYGSMYPGNGLGNIDVFTARTLDAGLTWHIAHEYTDSVPAAATASALPSLLGMLITAFTGMGIYYYEELPVSGTAGCLYCTPYGVFVWDDSSNEFYPYEYDGSRVVLTAPPAGGLPVPAEYEVN